MYWSKLDYVKLGVAAKVRNLRRDKVSLGTEEVGVPYTQ
jgi:hypothetical protein